MATGRLTITGEVGGVSINSSLTREGDGQIGVDPVLPAAKAGTLSTRSSHTVGELTLGSGHGITTAAVIDIYWDGGKRINVTVGTVNGTAVPISGGTGDDLPAEGTAITCSTQLSVDFAVDGNDLKIISAVCANAKCHVQFRSSSAALVDLNLPSGEPFVWKDQSIENNPFDGEVIASIRASQSDSTSTRQLRVGAIYDA